MTFFGDGEGGRDAKFGLMEVSEVLRKGQSGVVLLGELQKILLKKVNQGWFAWRGMWRIYTKELFGGCKSWWDYP